jgi:hypothetical protein
MGTESNGGHRLAASVALTGLLLAITSSRPFAAVAASVESDFAQAAPIEDDLLLPARDRLIAALAGSQPLKVDLSSRVATMNAAELVQANQQSVVPAAQAFGEIVKTYRADVQKVLEPLRSELRQQEALADQEQTRGIRIVLGEPKEFGKGYQGMFDGQMVYIETVKHKPQPIPNSIRLGLLDGQFLRDGNMEGTNAFGAKVTLPKFVDAPDAERRKRDQMADRLSGLERQSETMLCETTEKRAAGFTSTYKAILERAVTLVDGELASAVDAAKQAAGAPTAEQRVVDATAALKSLEWSTGVGSRWVEQTSAVLSAAADQFAKPRAELETTAASQLSEAAATLNSLGVSDSPLSVGHNARTLLTDITKGAKKSTTLAQLDAARDDYSKRLRAGLTEQSQSLIQQRQVAIGLTTAQDGLRVDHIASDGDDLLVAADFGPDQRNEQFQSVGVLRIRSGKVESTAKVSVDPTEHDAWPEGARALVRPLDGGWFAIQHGDCVTLITPNKKTALLPGTRADDLWRVKAKVLAHSRGTGGGEAPGLYSVTPEGEVQRATDSKDFAMVDGKAVAVTRELGGGSDRVDVVDPATGQPVPEFVSAWGRIRNFDASGSGTQAAIANGKMWVFNVHGVEGVSTGPTLISIDPTGKLGQPLFAHQTNGSGDDGGEVTAQPVGSAKLVVTGADNEIVVTRDRAYVYGKSSEQSQSGTVVAFDLATRREVWSEPNLRDPFNAVAEARKRHKEDGPGILEFTLVDKPNRGELKYAEHASPIAIDGKPKLVEVTISADGSQPVTWLVLDDGAYVKNAAGVDRGRLLRHGGRWYFGSTRVESVTAP